MKNQWGIALGGVILAAAWTSAGLAAPHGGNGGTPFTANCGANAVLVGMVGGAGNTLNRVQPVCVKVKADGSWDGATFTAGMHGGSGGSYYEKICPSGQAVVGIKGRSGSLVDQLELGCGTLGVSGGQIKIITVQGSAGAAGGNGGTPFTDLCPSGEIVLGLSGRKGSLIDQIDRSCGTLTPPAAAALSVSVSVSPQSTSPNFADCGANVSLTASSQGGPSGTPEYQFIWNRTTYSNASTDASGIIRAWSTSATATWTPQVAGRYVIQTLVRRGGQIASVNHTYIVRLGLTVSAQPASPSANPARVTVSAAPVCQPPATTMFYSFKVSSSARNHGSGGESTTASWTTPEPALPAGSYTLEASAWAVQGSSYSAANQVAVSYTRTLAYQVGSGGSSTGSGTSTGSTSTMTWTSPITSTTLGSAPSSFLLNKKISDIVNSVVSGRSSDSLMCNNCHTSTTSSRMYRPVTTATIAPNTSNNRGDASNSIYQWNQAGTTGVVERFCTSTTGNKPADLCAVFRRWAANNYAQ